MLHWTKQNNIIIIIINNINPIPLNILKFRAKTTILIFSVGVKNWFLPSNQIPTERIETVCLK